MSPTPATVSTSQTTQLDIKQLIRDHILAGAQRHEYQLTELYLLLDAAKQSFKSIPNALLELEAPVTICGDIHGQYSDLLSIFGVCGMPNTVRYLFLGDYVDRGRHSLEVIVLLFALQIQFPKRFFLLRGNHEVRRINNIYGFRAELAYRFPAATDWTPLYLKFNEVFAEMPLAALVSGKILCMHGGLSPEMNSLDDIRQIQRPIIQLQSGLAQDLIWADPEPGVEDFQFNSGRLVSVVFGESMVYKKLSELGCEMIVRAHQVTEFGHSFFANRKLVTIFSASRYNPDLCNWGSVALVDANLKMSFVSFRPAEYSSKKKYKKDTDTADELDEQMNVD